MSMLLEMKTKQVSINYKSVNFLSNLFFGLLAPEVSSPLTSPLTYDGVNADFYPVMLSPLLPEVQSLCLNGIVNDENNVKSVETESDALETINKESLKELLYGSSPNNFI